MSRSTLGEDAMELRTIDTGGLVHYAYFGGQGPRTIVLVHGLGGSLCNWAAAAPRLTHLGQVIALDLAGFGRSPWSPGAAQISSQRALLGRFLKAISPYPVVLVGNSMGGMLTMLQAAQEPATVAALVLVCPALLLAPLRTMEREIAAFFALGATPGLGEALARRRQRHIPPEKAVSQMLRLCGLDLRTMDPHVLHLHHELARERYRMPWAIPAFHEASRSLLMRLIFCSREVRQAMRAVRAPTLLMQGLTDRLVPAVTTRRAHQLCPAWTLDELPGQGHTPMLQNPDLFARRLTSWFQTIGA
ncbi:MAG: alpha/beta hydrolase [Myxococcales bacterium]|nr:alpha/beta hydrolase [Polyangiaceae bacterium]MDW8251831.1 alpha/beta hydrolase [Myxococcales bacterium]